jgi:PTH1 family peptidyl-tRNA hydrolase
MAARYLIVGLGNPGTSYDGTRHNIGFAVLDFVAGQQGLRFRVQARLKGELASGAVAGESVALLKPRTFMNLSGEAVQAALRFFDIGLERLLVVVDDVDLPFGQMRLKIDSGPGGHNGLKSVEECLQTNRYARLRIGVGDRLEGDLEGHVLGKFTAEEREQMPLLLERAAEAVKLFIEKGLTRAMDFANRKV